MENCALKSLLAVIDNKKEETLREIFFNKNLRFKELLLQLPLMLALPNLLRFCFGLQASNTVSFFFFLNFNAASTCGYAKYVFKTSLFPWGWPNQSQALNTGPKYSVIAREDANVESIWKKCVTILRKSLHLAKITYKENAEAQNIKACTDAQLNVVCVYWWNVICQISRVISRSIFQISFRAGRPW